MEPVVIPRCKRRDAHEKIEVILRSCPWGGSGWWGLDHRRGGVIHAILIPEESKVTLVADADASIEQEVADGAIKRGILVTCTG
jgi:hypothetical protein